ncbi:MAG: AraC family transcriptional regulator [Acidobacteriota bacterium]
MSNNNKTSLIYHMLYESSIVSVYDYRCRAGRGGPTVDEYSNINNIVLMRHGAFCKHFGRRSVTADVNQAVFFSKGSTYRISHPADCGDRGTIFAASPRLLKDIIYELDPSIQERPEQPFPFVLGPCAAGIFWRHRELVQRLEAAQSEPLEPLWADVTALQLIADILEAAFAQQGLPRKRRRNGTDDDHIDRAEAAKTYLASRLCERITLDDVASAVYSSPFHLARVFHERTSMPLHRYLTQLRLRASLEQLTAGAKDLTELALELGFSSHSHFADVFRREFGHTPSDVRRNASQRTLCEMSKNLKV